MPSRPESQRDPTGEGRDTDAVRQFIEAFALDLENVGMQRMAARVFAALLTSDSGQLTAGELAERIQVSPAAISGAVRYLTQVALIDRSREPGSRRDHYIVKDDSWFEAVTNKDSFYKIFADTLQDGVDAVGPDTPAGHRIAETRDFFEFVHGEMPAMIERWRQRRDAARAKQGR